MDGVDIELLRNLPLFAQLSAEEAAELGRTLRPRAFEAHQPIFWVGDEGTDFFVVQSGRVTLTYPDEQGHEITLADVGPGQFFGELSLLDGGPRTATARAQSDCTLLALGRADFLRFLQERPSAAGQIVTVLGARQRDMLDKLRGVKNVNEVVAESSTRWQRAADTIAAVSASQAFVLLHVAWFGAWMLGNTVAGSSAPDPYPFGLLTMIVSLEAIFLSIFVLVSQNRSGEKDRIRADLDYQVNLKAQHEIMQMHRKLDTLQAAVLGAARPPPSDAGAVAETNGTAGEASDGGAGRSDPAGVLERTA
jgi:CRP/FNR family cyclic AMP-dependent transcriptional regulator